MAGLFFLDRGGKSRVSSALWIPAAWLFICLSRPASQWLGVSPTVVDGSLYLEGSPLDRAVFLVLEAAALIVILGRQRRVSSILRENWAIGLFFFYAALSIVWSDYPLVTYKHWIKGIGDVMMVLIVATEADIVGAIERLVARLGFILVPLSVLFVKYYPMLGRKLNLSWEMEPVGVATQKNGLGELCGVLGLGIVWRLLSAYNDRDDPNRKRRMLALVVALAMVVWLLWTCNSMTSICSLGMASAVMLLSTRPTFQRKPALVHLAALAVPASSVYAIFFQSSGGLLQGLGRNPTLTGRTDVWRFVLSVPNNRFLGTGYESFWLGDRLLSMWNLIPGLKVQEAHNGYIEMFLNLGWIGVALLGLMIAMGYRNIFRGYRRNPGIGNLKIALFVAAVNTGLTEAAFRYMGPPWIAFLLAIMAPVVATRGDSGRRSLRTESASLNGLTWFEGERVYPLGSGALSRG